MGMALIRYGCQPTRGDVRPSTALAPGRRVPRTADLTPRDLSIGLTTLEGDQYRCLLPVDYICHLGKHGFPSGIDTASDINNRIIIWVEHTILMCNKVEARVEA